MLSVGQMLQAERERQGLSIEDVADRTKISLKNLRAIESDDSAAVLTAFFYKSFVRQFASTLAIDYSTLEVSPLPEFLVRITTQLMSRQSGHAGPGGGRTHCRWWR
jgi:transcriptional regulator with XRE-family HTH domain